MHLLSPPKTSHLYPGILTTLQFYAKVVYLNAHGRVNLRISLSQPLSSIVQKQPQTAQKFTGMATPIKL